ncbi:hypothetical protein PoB_002637100 [Plakobranchus ocellatus]|uniref:Uncharacterized protein n=1 Tax=Plakobranchus ocellatus TaxID=259542 RepID=A0AAV3ZZA7_9GAST|nr:hypothetical protein PoB_002637100 [Plakobranchus ocellatus]
MAAAVFNLEEILPYPSSRESCLSNKRKLNVFNLTVYDYRDGQGFCHIWSEVEALRGSNEIVSSVDNYLKRLKEQSIQEVVSFSDSCGGQNRTKNFFSML